MAVWRKFSRVDEQDPRACTRDPGLYGEFRFMREETIAGPRWEEPIRGVAGDAR